MKKKADFHSDLEDQADILDEFEAYCKTYHEYKDVEGLIQFMDKEYSDTPQRIKNLAIKQLEKQLDKEEDMKLSGDIRKMAELIEKNSSDEILIISDADAGGGATIDMYYNKRKNEVITIKKLADGREEKYVDSYKDFEPEIYGKAGEEFIDEVEELKEKGKIK